VVLPTQLTPARNTHIGCAHHFHCIRVWTIGVQPSRRIEFGSTRALADARRHLFVLAQPRTGIKLFDTGAVAFDHAGGKVFVFGLHYFVVAPQRNL
jgi:hypothetical protein